MDTPREFLQQTLPRCLDSVNSLSNLIRVNPHLTEQVIELAITIGAAEAERNLKGREDQLNKLADRMGLSRAAPFAPMLKAIIEGIE
jgi:hypothetical protein